MRSAALVLSLGFVSCVGVVSDPGIDAGATDRGSTAMDASVEVDGGNDDAGTPDSGLRDAGLPPPTTATLFGSRTATVNVPLQVRVVLNTPAQQTYTVTWSASDSATFPASSTIAIGDTRATADIVWAATGTGRTVDFTIDPPLTRAQNPLTVDVTTLSVPTWLASAPVLEWRQIPNTNAPGEIRDFGGLAWRDDGTGLEAWSGVNGGHGGNLTNNRVMSIRLDVETPTWVERKAASDPTGFDTQGSMAYMLDGTPAPRHTYWYNWWVPQLNRYMLLGGRFFGSGAYDHRVTDGFDPVTNTWDPKGTYPDHDDRITFIRNGEFMGMYDDRWVKLVLPGVTFTGGQVSGTGTIARAGHAWDSRHDRIYHLSSGDNWSVAGAINSAVVDPTTTPWTKTAITFNPSAGWTDFQAQTPNFLGTTMVYDRDADCFYFYNGGIDGPQKVYRITANSTTTWDMDVLPVTGVVPIHSIGTGGGGGVHTKFYYSSRLRTIFLIAGAHDVYYLRLG